MLLFQYQQYAFQKPTQVENGNESNEVGKSRSELSAIDGAQENEDLFNSKNSITQSFANPPLIAPPLPTKIGRAHV